MPASPARARSPTLDPAERHPRVRRHHGVDEDHAGLDVLDEPLALGGSLVQALAPSPKGESLASRIASSTLRDAEQHRHRAEHLLVIRRRVGRDVGEHRGRVAEARAGRAACRR